MFAKKCSSLILAAVLTVAMPYAAQAAWPVIDIGAIAQLLLQIQTLEKQLSTAKDHLTEARKQFESMTGGRGMERLLSGTARNYLPADWQQLSAVLNQASTTYHALSANVQSVINANAVLTAGQLSALAPAERDALESGRRSAAMLQVMAREALANTSNRFASIQQLIDAIPRATDQKAILDLQARIQAEQGMLANEQTKLNVLNQAAQAEELARRQRVREQALASVGSLRALPAMGL
jgi:type IV secretion system protein VirB5